MATPTAKTQPKKVTVDGQTVENRDMDDLRKQESDDAVSTIRASKKAPFKSFSLSMPGSVY